MNTLNQILTLKPTNRLLLYTGWIILALQVILYIHLYPVLHEFTPPKMFLLYSNTFVSIAFLFIIRSSKIKLLKKKTIDENEKPDTRLMLAEQERELLKEALERVQALKAQQDQDYFLASLLLKPLAVNRSAGKQSQVDFLVRQKKQFNFKKLDEEIGGDLCVADTLVLQDKTYTVFINADAMGKSIQGAGGALVAGALFQAAIVKAKTSRICKQQSPAQWLRRTFYDLQRTMQSFDGFMMVSAIFGLLEEETGQLCFINAEHPSLTLYRSGKAVHLEDFPSTYKLGMLTTGEPVRIKTFKMLPGDVLLAGSDGKDDLLLGYDEDNRPLRNHDESLFLECVEEGAGDLEQIAVALEQRGEIADDLSFVKITYSG